MVGLTCYPQSPHFLPPLSPSPLCSPLSPHPRSSLFPLPSPATLGSTEARCAEARRTEAVGPGWTVSATVTAPGARLSPPSRQRGRQREEIAAAAGEAMIRLRGHLSPLFFHFSLLGCLICLFALALLPAINCSCCLLLARQRRNRRIWV